MKWKPAAVAAITGIASLAIYLVSRPGHDPVPVVQTPAPRYIAAEGKLEALPGAEIDVGTAMTARIERYLVDKGQHVDKGQVIAILDSQELAAHLNQANAALRRARSEREQAEREFNRTVQLHKDKFMSQAALDNAGSAYKVAKSKVSEAEANVRYMRSLLDKTSVVSPISGTLIERYLEAGEVAMPEKPLAAVADTDRLRINAEVDETDAGRLRLGDPAEISAYAYPGRTFKGRVEEIADYVGKREIKPNNPAVNLGLKIIQVKIALLEPTPLKLGMTVDVRIAPADKKPGAN